MDDTNWMDSHLYGNHDIPLEIAKLTPALSAKIKPEKTKQDGRKKVSWREEWYQFSQNTTMHGVNKVTEETPFKLRRYERFFS